MSAYKRNVVVGAVVLVALLGLAWMILKFAGQAMNYFLERGIRITLVTERADGVLDGSPILYRGMNAGRVTTVTRRASDDRIVIEALVDATPPLPANLKGRIRMTSLLGGSSQILLVPESDRQVAERLKEGDQLPAEYVPDLTSLGDQVREQKVIEHMDQTIVLLSRQLEKAGQILDSVRDVAADPKLREDVRAAVQNVRAATETARQAVDRINAMAERAEGTMKEIQGGVADARLVVSDMRGTVGEVRGTVTDTRGHVNRLGKDLTRQLDRVASALEHFDSVAAKVDKGQGSAGQFVNDPRLYQSLADTADEMKGAVLDLRRLVQQWEQEGLPVKLGK
jgi:phospholipid/cholesterol/gamma-HCH transport system substrate-binding protein